MTRLSRWKAQERPTRNAASRTPKTARRAVRELRDRGLVVTVPGRGTFVRPDADDDED